MTDTTLPTSCRSNAENNADVEAPFSSTFTRTYLVSADNAENKFAFLRACAGATLRIHTPRTYTTTCKIESFYPT